MLLSYAEQKLRNIGGGRHFFRSGEREAAKKVGGRCANHANSINAKTFCSILHDLTIMKLLTFILPILIALISYGQTKSYDLAIKNATVFDSKAGTLSKNRTILIKAGISIRLMFLATIMQRQSIYQRSL